MGMAGKRLRQGGSADRAGAWLDCRWGSDLGRNFISSKSVDYGFIVMSFLGFGGPAGTSFLYPCASENACWTVLAA